MLFGMSNPWKTASSSWFQHFFSVSQNLAKNVYLYLVQKGGIQLACLKLTKSELVNEEKQISFQDTIHLT